MVARTNARDQDMATRPLRMNSDCHLGRVAPYPDGEAAASDNESPTSPSGTIDGSLTHGGTLPVERSEWPGIPRNQCCEFRLRDCHLSIVRPCAEGPSAGRSRLRPRGLAPPPRVRTSSRPLPAPPVRLQAKAG